MSYALFAQEKVVLTGRLNSVSLQQTQRSDEQFKLATDTLSLQQQMTSIQASQATELAAQYQSLADATTDVQRSSINAIIEAMEQRFQNQIDVINRKIYLVSVKENAVEMMVKRLDTQVSAIQQQLDAISEAESKGIERGTPKFQGVG